MKYEKLIFIYPFSIGSFLNAKIGLEATLEDGDDVDECYAKLSMEVKRLAVKEQGGTMPPEWAKDFHQVTTSSINLGRVFMGVPSEDDIQKIESLKDLEEVCFPAIDKLKDEEQKRKLWIVYDKKFEELKNRPSHD